MSQLTLDIDKNYIHFLSESENKYYFELPSFTDEDRKHFFNISGPEYSYFNNLLTDHSKIYYLLLSGYYKATNTIYTLMKFTVPLSDLEFIAHKYQIAVDTLTLSRNSINKHKLFMCNQFKFRIYASNEHRSSLISKADSLAKIHIKPLFIFTELCGHLKTNAITMPSYREFQMLIGAALKKEKVRLAKKLNRLPKNVDDYLNQILNSNKKLNLTSILQKHKSSSNQEISQEIDRLNSIQEVFKYIKSFTLKLNISSESIKYYASLVSYHGRGRLARLDDPIVKLYIICYIQGRFKKINDSLIESFRVITSKYYTESKSTALATWSDSEGIYQNKKEQLADIIAMHYEDNDIDNRKFSEVKKISHSLISVEDMKQAVTYMRREDNRKNKLIWQSLGESQARFKKNLRKIFIHLNVTAMDRDLSKSLKFLNDHLSTKDKDSIAYKLYPKGIIPSNLRTILISKSKNKRKVNFAQYEYLVYWTLSEHLKSGDAYVTDSIDYRKFEDDLITDKSFEKQDLNDLGLSFLNLDIHQHLDELKKISEERIAEVNEHIALGVNKALNIKNWHNREWTLPYIKSDVEVNNPFFESINQINIVDVMLFCDDKTGYLDELTHLLPKNVRSAFKKDGAIACLLALATNHGIYRMSKISNTTYDVLIHCKKSFFSMENIERCCNKIANAIEKLKAFDGYDINGYLHGGIDGQKHKTKNQVPSATTSQKYYHLGSSFTSNTLLVNHVPANAVAFGSNEHESRYVFDLVYNNETDIQPEIISTDNAGVNAVNFALLNMLGKTFAPCFKKITNKDSMIIGFNKPSYYRDKDYFLRPSRQAKPNIIIDEWPNIKKIMVSLALKESSQSVLVRKLCGTARKNTTKEALWEYDSIIRSNYILRYVNDEPLRKSVRTALNRTESYHQLKRTISTVNSSSVLGGSDDDVMLNDQCSRLLSLMVIFYNGFLLSEIMSIKEENGKSEELKYYKHISLVAWTHINFHGYYNFNRQLTHEHLQAIIEEIASLSPDITG